MKCLLKETFHNESCFNNLVVMKIGYKLSIFLLRKSVTSLNFYVSLFSQTIEKNQSHYGKKITSELTRSQHEWR
jgi:hypothetical protein